MADVKTSKARFNRFRAKVFNMVSTGVIDEPLNRFYDVLSIFALALKLFAVFAITLDYMEEHYKGLLLAIEAVTTFFFAIDYFLRFFTAKELYPKLSEQKSILKYIFSFSLSLMGVAYQSWWGKLFLAASLPQCSHTNCVVSLMQHRHRLFCISSHLSHTYRGNVHKIYPLFFRKADIFFFTVPNSRSC